MPGRTVHVVADSAYAGKALRNLPPHITWTTRLRSNAALHALVPPRTGKRRPRLKRDRLASLTTLAQQGSFTETTVHRYGATLRVHTAVITCLWYSVFGPQPCRWCWSATTRRPVTTSPWSAPT